MKNLKKFYTGIKNYYVKKYDHYFKNFDDSIINEVNKKINNQIQSMTHQEKLAKLIFKKYILPIANKNINKKSKAYLISLISLMDFFLFDKKFNYIDPGYGISYIKQYYKNLEDLD